MMQVDSDANIKDAHGNSPLIYCMKERPGDFIDRCVYLIQNGTKLKEKYYENENFLLTVLKVYRKAKCMEILPKISYYIDDYSVVDERGQNAMHYVFKKKPGDCCLELFNYLTAAGVTFNRTDDNDVLPVMHALKNCFELPLLRRLIQESPINYRDTSGNGFFHYLCKSNSSFDSFRKCCKMLVANGESINMQDHDGMLPAFESIANPHFSWKYIEFLHSCGANLKTKDRFGRSAAVFALVQNREEKDMCLLLRYLFTTWK